MTARPRLAALLALEAHPEGGWYRRTWATDVAVRPPGTAGGRASATGIHYVLGADEESAWHRVRSDELWAWHRGAALSLWLGGSAAEPDPAAVREVVLGDRVEDGERPQLLVPAGCWQRARPRPGTGAADDGAVLVSCVVSPGFDFADFTLAGDTPQ